MLLNENRAVRLMEENNIECLIATLPENVYYFTEFAGWTCRLYKEWQSIPSPSNAGRPAYAVLMRNDPSHPVLIIPMIWFLYGQKTGSRGIIGAIISFSGVAILFLI